MLPQEERDIRSSAEISKPILESFQSRLFSYRKPNLKPLALGTQRARLGAIQRFFARYGAKRSPTKLRVMNLVQPSTSAVCRLEEGAFA
ncbi:MAG: hypothetical protein ACJAQT_001727 [Akkermansiaceae bacterium]